MRNSINCQLEYSTKQTQTMLRYINKANEEEAVNGELIGEMKEGWARKKLYEYRNHKPGLLLQALDNSHHKSGAFRETTEALHLKFLSRNKHTVILFRRDRYITGCAVVCAFYVIITDLSLRGGLWQRVGQIKSRPSGGGWRGGNAMNSNTRS
jgi:hypothetical protein